MPRISRLDRSEVAPENATLYDNTFAQRDNVPNIFRVMTRRQEFFATMQTHFGAGLNMGSFLTSLRELAPIRPGEDGCAAPMAQIGASC